MAREELAQIQKLLTELKGLAKLEILAEVPSGNETMPIHKITFGSNNPEAPVLGLIGGVHGLERIGAQVCLAILNSFGRLLLWDQSIHRSLENLRIFFIPVVNPWGILNRKRSNANGVDLMRNAPIEARGPVPWLLGGHRYGRSLPWYRGQENTLELEAQAVLRAVELEIKQSPVVVTVDFHSGYGVQDQIWFPGSFSQNRWPDLASMYAFKKLFDQTYPHHFYRIEPPAYQVHGDLWDYTDLIYRGHNPSGTYLPLTLEMGSWNWIKKNPLQFFSKLGAFNPVVDHRLHRTLRRHNTFFEFLIRALNSPGAWTGLSEEQKGKNQVHAQELWSLR